MGSGYSVAKWDRFSWFGIVFVIRIRCCDVTRTQKWIFTGSPCYDIRVWLHEYNAVSLPYSHNAQLNFSHMWLLMDTIWFFMSFRCSSFDKDIRYTIARSEMVSAVASQAQNSHTTSARKLTQMPWHAKHKSRALWTWQNVEGWYEQAGNAYLTICLSAYTICWSSVELASHILKIILKLL